METNYRKGEVEVEFGDDAKLIRYDLNAICILEQNLEMPFHSILKSFGYNTAREAIFVGLRHKGNKKISRADVGKMMGAGGHSFEYYAACVLEAVRGATGRSDLTVAIDKLRATFEDVDEDEDDGDEDEDAKVEGCNGPDAGNAQAAQTDTTGPR